MKLRLNGEMHGDMWRTGQSSLCFFNVLGSNHSELLRSRSHKCSRREYVYYGFDSKISRRYVR